MKSPVLHEVRFLSLAQKALPDCFVVHSVVLAGGTVVANTPPASVGGQAEAAMIQCSAAAADWCVVADAPANILTLYNLAKE